MTPETALYALWIAWFVSWHVAMAWRARLVRRDESPQRIFTILLMVAGFALILGIYRTQSNAALRLWRIDASAAWTAVGGTALAFAFMWWARLHLGRLWSGGIDTRENHRVVDSGPYALVRHPIYTGLLLAGLCMAVFKATPIAWAGFGLVLTALILKARAEERFLVKELGTAYAAYRARVPMLVPFFPSPK